MTFLPKIPGIEPVATYAGLRRNSSPAPTPAPPSPPVLPPPPATTTFKNPLLDSGPDPWVAQKDGFYYFMRTTRRRPAHSQNGRMADLGTSSETVIWRPDGKYRDIWAPELYFFDGKWYVYFSADAMCCGGHRVWVLENPAADPTTGTWTMVGKINTADDNWAIDGTVLEQSGQRYLVWSGHRDFEQQRRQPHPAPLHRQDEQPDDADRAAGGNLAADLRVGKKSEFAV